MFVETSWFRPAQGPGGTAFTGTDITVWMVVAAALLLLGGRLPAGCQASRERSSRVAVARELLRVGSDLEHGRREEACHVAPQPHG